MLNKENRLKKDKDFQDVYKKGKFFGTKFIHFKIKKNNLEKTRIGFVVGIKVNKSAVKRNKIKRQVREIFRLNLNKIKSGFDIVVILKPGVLDLNYIEIEKNVLFALKKMRLLSL